MTTDKQTAIERLHTVLRPGQEVHTVCVSSSKGAGSSHYKVLIIDTVELHTGEVRPRVRDITFWVASACGFRMSDKTGGLLSGGWGLSRSFQVVYSLGRTLWPKGTPEPHGTRNGEPDRDGGYALSHRQI